MTLQELMHRADIRNDEFAALMGVATITVLKWKAGGNVHALHADKFDEVCIAMSEAIYRKELPLDQKRERGSPPTERVNAAKRILNKYLDARFKFKLNA